MSATKIKIYKRTWSIVDGRRVKGDPELFYNPWAEISQLYGTELYQAIDIRLKQTVVFKVRYCKKIKELQQDMKQYYIIYDGNEYDIYATDNWANDRQFVQLKANRTD